jgi:hypothetical protein
LSLANVHTPDAPHFFSSRHELAGPRLASYFLDVPLPRPPSATSRRGRDWPATKGEQKTPAADPSMVASPRHVPRPPRSPLGLEPPRAGVARPANTTPRNQTASVAASERAYNNDVSGLGRGDRGVPGCSWPVSLPPARGRRRARRWRILGRGRDWPATSSTFHFLGRRRPRETAEKVGRPGGLSPGVERLVSYQNA